MKREDTPERNIMAFIEFFEEDGSGNWREQLEEIRLRYPGTYKEWRACRSALTLTASH